jgi:hypothetical protein
MSYRNALTCHASEQIQGKICASLSTCRRTVSRRCTAYAVQSLTEDVGSYLIPLSLRQCIDNQYSLACNVILLSDDDGAVMGIAAVRGHRR